MQVLMGAIVRQPIKARATPYLSCKNDSGGLAWLVTSETTSGNAVIVRNWRPLPPIAPLKPLACGGPGELLHVDFTSIEETVPLHQEPVIRNVMVMQDHFSKYVVAYVVKDQVARTATEMLRNGYFGERSRNLDRSFRNIYIILSFPTREQHAHSVQNARSRFTKLNQ